MEVSHKILTKLLLRSNHHQRRWSVWLLLIGGLWLLFSVGILWYNFHGLLFGKYKADNLSSSYINLTKQATNSSNDQSSVTTFSHEEIMALQQLKGIEDVAGVSSVQFPVILRLNIGSGFMIPIYLESVPDRFIDQLPEDWYWNPGNKEVPILLYRDLLNSYNNGFALSQNLPQYADTNFKQLIFDLELGRPDNKETYSAHIMGYSDRITGILVPPSFLEFANQSFSNIPLKSQPSKLIIKLRDPSDGTLQGYFKQHHYITNAGVFNWSLLRASTEVVYWSLGSILLLILVVSMYALAILFPSLLYPKKQTLSLLIEMGYSPSSLYVFLYRKLILYSIFCLILAVVLSLFTQFLIELIAATHQLSLPSYPIELLATFVGISTLLMIIFLKFSINRTLAIRIKMLWAAK